ncbi:MAG: 4Fe-4S dicluster domain-containing protein [Anaerolineae bacterium]
MEVSQKHLGIPRALIPWYPIIDQEHCTGCMICVKACKHNVFAMDTDRPIVANPYECVVFCQSCEYVCEVGAISHPPKEAVKQVIRELRRQYPPS